MCQTWQNGRETCSETLPFFAFYFMIFPYPLDESSKKLYD